MDDVFSGIINQEPAQIHALNQHWLATLSLGFEKKGDRSQLSNRQHTGPLVIQKVLYPEGDGVCHGVIIHPPGGVAGGDALTLNVQLANGAAALLTTPGAGKWYKANGQPASQQLHFDLQEQAVLEWFPQENILFDGAAVNFGAEINLAPQAVYAGWEILCFGRQARGERWLAGHLNQRLRIRRATKLIWQESAALIPDDRFFHSLTGLAGNVVSGGFVVAAGDVPRETLAACQAVQADAAGRFGVTALPEVFSARYVGMSAPAARQYFETLWQIIRPWYASRQAVRPRIWNT